MARTETVAIDVMPLGNSLFAVSWQEKDGATVRLSRTMLVA
ncbi:MoaF-related domain-containing protein [Falsiroseomonas sp. HC035]